RPVYIFGKQGAGNAELFIRQTPRGFEQKRIKCGLTIRCKGSNERHGPTRWVMLRGVVVRIDSAVQRPRHSGSVSRLQAPKHCAACERKIQIVLRNQLTVEIFRSAGVQLLQRDWSINIVERNEAFRRLYSPLTCQDAFGNERTDDDQIGISNTRGKAIAQLI